MLLREIFVIFVDALKISVLFNQQFQFKEYYSNHYLPRALKINKQKQKRGEKGPPESKLNFSELLETENTTDSAYVEQPKTK